MSKAKCKPLLQSGRCLKSCHIKLVGDVRELYGNMEVNYGITIDNFRMQKEHKS